LQAESVAVPAATNRSKAMSRAMSLPLIKDADGFSRSAGMDRVPSTRLAAPTDPV
jgi:hypothetical protein